MAFIRVVADVRVDFGGTRAPIERKGLELATGSGFVVAPSGLRPDEPARRRRQRSEEPFPRGRSGGLGREPAHRGRDRQRRRAGGVRGARGRIRRRERPRGPAGDSRRPAVPRPRGLGRARVRASGAGPGLPVRPPGRGGEAGGRGGRARGDGDRRAPSPPRARTSRARRALPPDGRHRSNPGNSGGPMLDEDGYVVGVVRMKLARDATSQGAGFSVPVNVVKDFLEANSLLEQLPVSRLRPGVRHTLDWKRISVELPDGYSDGSPSRVVADAGERVRSASAPIGWRPTGPWPPSRKPCWAGARCRDSCPRRRGRTAGCRSPGAGPSRSRGKPPERDRVGLGCRWLRSAVPRRVRDRGPGGREGRRTVRRPGGRRRVQPRASSAAPCGAWRRAR